MLIVLLPMLATYSVESILSPNTHVVPLKATLGFLLSIASTFGALVAVFQWGWLKDLFGINTTGPVIALLESEDPRFVGAAAERGIFAYVRPINPATVQSAIEIAVRRHAEIATLTEQVDRLENALERRAIIERAKGILMERHSLADRAAFEMLREHARSHSRSVVEIARSVEEGHALLPRRD